MKVKVERCNNQTFRLTLPDGRRESISNPDNGWWNRSAASRALNVLSQNYSIPRHTIKFYHVN